jgi:hypothetical protein
VKLLRSDDREASRKAEPVELHVPIEAAAADAFVAQVNAMDKEQIGATACLCTLRTKEINDRDVRSIPNSSPKLSWR